MRILPRPRFSLRALLALVTLCAILSAWAGRYVYHKQLILHAVAGIRDEGGLIRTRRGDSQWERAVFGEAWCEIVDGIEFTHNRPSNEFLRRLRFLPELRTLAFPGTPIGDEELIYLKPLVGLESLAISGSRITAEGVAQLPDFERLESVILDESQLSPQSTAWLRRQPSLKALVLEGTNWDGDKLALLERPAVESLILRGDELTECGAEELKNWPKLTLLILNLKSKPPSVLGPPNGELVNHSQIPLGTHWSCRLDRMPGDREFVQLVEPVWSSRGTPPPPASSESVPTTE